MESKSVMSMGWKFELGIFILLSGSEVGFVKWCTFEGVLKEMWEYKRKLETKMGFHFLRE